MMLRNLILSALPIWKTSMDSYLLWLVLWLFTLLPILWMISSRFQFLVKSFSFMFCFVMTGVIAGLYCVPFGRTTANHYRIFWIFRVLTTWTNIQVKCHHLEHLMTEKPCIVICNHQSALDVLTMTYVWPQKCVCMMKASLKYLPGFNLSAYMAKAVFIDRFTKENAHKSLDSTMHAIEEYKYKVWIFPEGTRNHTAEPFLPFKKGAFVLAKRAKVPIVPLVFSSYKHFYDKDKSKFDLNGHVVAEALPAIDSDQYETLDQLSDECRKRMLTVYERISKEAAQWHTSSVTVTKKDI